MSPSADPAADRRAGQWAGTQGHGPAVRPDLTSPHRESLQLQEGRGQRGAGGSGGGDPDPAETGRSLLLRTVPGLGPASLRTGRSPVWLFTLTTRALAIPPDRWGNGGTEPTTGLGPSHDLPRQG